MTLKGFNLIFCKNLFNLNRKSRLKASKYRQTDKVFKFALLEGGTTTDGERFFLFSCTKQNR